MTHQPSRIVCLSAETADLCARLGVWDQVVAVTAYFKQAALPPRPIVSGFSSGSAELIMSHRPDLVLAFSDVQAALCADLLRAGATVFATNQRTLAETATAMRQIARLLGHPEAGEDLASAFERELEALRASRDRRPRVYFEEWPDPPIFGIPWISELIEITGGHDIFAERRAPAAQNRRITDLEVIAADPEFILASWCGRPVDPAALERRFAGTAAIRYGRLYSLPAEWILQPGWGLLEGARHLRKIFDTLE